MVEETADSDGELPTPLSRESVAKAGSTSAIQFRKL